MKKFICPFIKTISTSLMLGLIVSFGFGAKFYFEEQVVTGYLNCPLELNILIDTEDRNVSAADMILRYNDKNIYINGLIPSKLFNINRGLKREENRVRSTSVSLPKIIYGTGDFGTLVITPKKLGDTKIIFEVKRFGLDSTLDTNLAFKGQDILTSVKNINIKVITGDCLEKDARLTGFVEYNNDMPYKDFEEKWIKKITAKDETVNVKDSYGKGSYETKYIIRYGIIILLILLIILLLVKKSKFRKLNTKGKE